MRLCTTPLQFLRQVVRRNGGLRIPRFGVEPHPGVEDVGKRVAAEHRQGVEAPWKVQRGSAMLSDEPATNGKAPDLLDSRRLSVIGGGLGTPNKPKGEPPTPGRQI